MPSGAPGGKPKAGSGTKSPPATRPAPKTAISRGPQMPPALPRRSRRTPTAKAMNNRPLTSKLSSCIQPRSPRRSMLMACRLRSKPERVNACRYDATKNRGPAATPQASSRVVASLAVSRPWGAAPCTIFARISDVIVSPRGAGTALWDVDDRGDGRSTLGPLRQLRTWRGGSAPDDVARPGGERLRQLRGRIAPLRNAEGVIRALELAQLRQRQRGHDTAQEPRVGQFVARPLQEEHRHAHLAQVVGPLGRRLTRGMERKADEGEPHHARQRRAGLCLRRHAAAERLPAHDERQVLARGALDGLADAAVQHVGRIDPPLPRCHVRELVAQRRHAERLEGVGHGLQEGMPHARSGAVRQSPAASRSIAAISSRCAISTNIATSYDSRGDSAAGDGADDEERLGAAFDSGWHRFVGGIVGEIFLTREEAQERAPLPGGVVADGAAQHGMTRLQRIQDRVDGDGALDLERHLAVDVREPAQMSRQLYADHGSVWTSTESTAGRSRTMGFQLSPASGEQ